MRGFSAVELVWGRSSTAASSAPILYPLLALLAIAASIAPTTWFLPSFYGYLLSGGLLCLVILYGLVVADIPIRIDPIFLTLIGGYWLGLVAHLLYAPTPPLREYVFVTPIAVVATVVVLPRLVEPRKQAFAMGLAGLAVVLMVIGTGMLVQSSMADAQLYSWVGTEVMGRYPIRTPSVFSNPNTYGYFMMIGGLAALYTVLDRGGLVWVGALALCLLGLLMSEGDTSLLGFSVGAIVVLSGRDRRLSIVGIAGLFAAAYALIRIGHLPTVMETTLLTRANLWVLSIERLAADPLWGIGFVDAGAAIGAFTGPHNSYLEALLHTGLIAGGLYLGALVYALAQGIRRRWTLWTGYIVGTAVAQFSYMTFESLFLGGLSTSSVMLGLVIGLMLLPRERAVAERFANGASASSGVASTIMDQSQSDSGLR